MYKFVGDGWIDGVPARDLTEEDFNKLSKAQQEAVRNSKLYKHDYEAKKPKVVKGDQE